MLYFSWQEAAKFTLPRSVYLIYSIFKFWDWNAVWGWQVLAIPELMWSSTPAYCWFQFRAVVHQIVGHTVKCIGKQYPGRCVLAEQKPSLSLSSSDPPSFKVRTEIFSSIGNAAFLQQESGLCWGLESPWLTGLSPWQLHPCPLSTLEECFKKTWNQNILLGDCFLSFLLQASWIAVSELSIIIGVEQWSLLLTGSFSEPCCAGFIIISQG